MATYNQMQVQQKPKFSVAITTKGYQSLISNTLRDPARARRFTASITSAVAVNPALQECDAGTILAGALLGESLNLSPSPQLGQYYLVPFKQKAKYDRNNRLIRPESVTAQFVLGYKGYIQLALRSGQYKDLDVMVIKQGEYLGKDPETGKAKFQFVEDDDQRDALPTVGYGRRDRADRCPVLQWSAVSLRPGGACTRNHQMQVLRHLQQIKEGVRVVFTREDAARAAQTIGIDFKKEAFQLEDLLNGMNTELARHGTKAGTVDVTHDDPTMTAKLAVANLRVSPSYYSQRVGKSAWERSLARGVKHKGAKTEYKTVEFELEGFDDKEGTFSGYGAVFSNIDSGGDIIEPGAFTKTIAEGIGRVKILSGHNDSLLPIGIPTELREDAKGLFMSAKISDTTLGRDVKTLIHDGVLCELSIGYDPVVFDYDENGIRHLREVKLWEISVVTWAMNEQAVITDHKSDDAATRIEAEAQAIVTEIKAGRKISASRMKSLKDACMSMKAATKLLDKIISEAQGDNGKGHPPVSAHKSVERKSAPKKTVEIIF